MLHEVINTFTDWGHVDFGFYQKTVKGKSTKFYSMKICVQLDCSQKGILTLFSDTYMTDIKTDEWMN